MQGQFVGGRLELRDADGLVLLAGNIYEALAYEVFADQPYLPVTLTINGMFRADSGSLLTDFTGPNGKIYEIIFSITPRAIDGFSEAFSGQSNISLAPMIPEPLTIGLFSLALGGLALSRRRKR
ncbi:MAG TPA: PEP-CTERM sorting domain-containing protein [Planctomycetota bacterium]|nr:PEP-CTERM sorting domain-containing protein [Planctomycetota bacterium]